MTDARLVRLAAFTEQPGGGNPAGVWSGEALPDTAEMQRIAAEVGYSETAFLAAAEDGRWRTRYYSPQAEVPFCGHATIASGVDLGSRFGDGLYRLDTAVGEVPVKVTRGAAGVLRATLTSVEPAQRALPATLLAEALECLGWSATDLDPALPPALAYAGAWHLVIAVAERPVLAALSYDFDRLRRQMLNDELTTLQLVWRQDETTFHARNPFPVGGVVEDPATGAAAAALGGYLRSAALVTVPATLTVRQGEDMGRPSRITVSIPSRGGIDVTGSAIPIDGRAR